MFDGVYCIFNILFFYNFYQLVDYEIFQFGGNYIFELMDEQVVEVQQVFEEMEQEFNFVYKYKFDVVCNCVFDLIYYGLKLEFFIFIQWYFVDVAYWIFCLFIELLEW